MMKDDVFLNPYFLNIMNVDNIFKRHPVRKKPKQMEQKKSKAYFKSIHVSFFLIHIIFGNTS